VDDVNIITLPAPEPAVAGCREAGHDRYRGDLS
jgi:hypothetical protein